MATIVKTGLIICDVWNATDGAISTNNYIIFKKGQTVECNSVWPNGTVSVRVIGSDDDWEWIAESLIKFK